MPSQRRGQPRGAAGRASAKARISLRPSELRPASHAARREVALLARPQVEPLRKLFLSTVHQVCTRQCADVSHRGQRSSNGAASSLGQTDSSNAFSTSLSLEACGAADCGHCKRDFSMPGGPRYQHRLPSTSRQDQCPMRVAGNSALHCTALFADVHSGVNRIAAAMR